MSELDFGPKPGIEHGGEAEPGAPMRSPVSDARQRRGDDELDRSLRPRTLGEFIGQTRVREQLGVFVDAAKARDEALDHALFAGPPGLGKCVTPDTVVFTTHGMEPIGALGHVGGESWQPIARPLATLYGVRTADYFYDNGVGPTLRITTSAGYRVEGTPNHPVLVRDDDGRVQFRRLGELRSGDHVAVRLGAQVFGSSTRVHVEGVQLPSLADPAHVPSDLEPDLARLLGLLLDGGQLAPDRSGVVFVTRHADRAAEVRRLLESTFHVPVESLGTGPFGDRIGARSPRFAHLLHGLGLAVDGFHGIPSCIYAAPRLLVADFLRGLFWGGEHAPTLSHADRVVVAHVQLMLANMGIESRIEPVERGWRVRASSEPARFELVDTARVDEAHALAGHVHEHVDEPADADARQRTMRRAAATTALVDRAVERVSAGFGITTAGVLVALGDDDTTSYRRGASRADDIRRVHVRNTGRVHVESITVAEVEPSERGRAVLREHSHDHRVLAVRSARSGIRRDDMVELTWEPVASIEPGHAHTVDVSVPDGHTFIGNGIVCHNTTLASVVARELDATMHTTSGPALEKKADVAAILTSLGPRDVLFIDEIHRLSTPIEEVLYTAMEDYQIDIVLGQGPAARTLRLDLEPFTLVGATTRTGLLTTPLRDRFGIMQRLEYYDVDELTDVVRRSARLMELVIDDEAAREIAGRSRGTPRIANRLLRRVRDVAQVRHDGELTLDVAQEALDLVDVDGIGLDRTDRMVLEAINTTFGGGPVGLSTLAVAVGEEPHTIEDVYEPFLLQRGFIQRTPRGRIITPRGRAHIGARASGDGLF